MMHFHICDRCFISVAFIFWLFYRLVYFKTWRIQYIIIAFTRFMVRSLIIPYHLYFLTLFPFAIHFPIINRPFISMFQLCWTNITRLLNHWKVATSKFISESNSRKIARRSWRFHWSHFPNHVEINLYQPFQIKVSKFIYLLHINLLYHKSLINIALDYILLFVLHVKYYIEFMNVLIEVQSIILYFFPVVNVVKFFFHLFLMLLNY